MHGMPIYLDYQATTPLDARVAAAMAPYWRTRFGNPHSDGHRYGWDARAAVTAARAEVAASIGADDEEITFTSGATESCNLAIRGVVHAAAAAKTGRTKIITVATEHPAVLETVQWLGAHGFQTVILPVDGQGLLDLSVLDAALDTHTLLVSVMAVNNEIGALQPLVEIADRCRRAGAFLHTDATQAVGRMRVDVEQLGVDMLSMSAHKMYGPNGIGALFVRNRPDLTLEPLTTGGAQEHGLRPGTVPVPLAVGFGEACRIAAREWRSDATRIRGLTERLLTGLRDACPGLNLFGPCRERIPGSLNVGFPGLSAEEVIAGVSDRIAISTGSACSSATAEPSKVLLALKLGPEAAASGVRISLGRFTTEDDVREACRVLTALPAPMEELRA